MTFERDYGYKQLINAIAAIPCETVAPSDADLLLIANCIANNRIRTERIARSCILPKNITWRIEGPFDSSYSLALLNRETALVKQYLAEELVGHISRDSTAMPVARNR